MILFREAATIKNSKILNAKFHPIKSEKSELMTTEWPRVMESQRFRRRLWARFRRRCGLGPSCSVDLKGDRVTRGRFFESLVNVRTMTRSGSTGNVGVLGWAGYGGDASVGWEIVMARGVDKRNCVEVCYRIGGELERLTFPTGSVPGGSRVMKSRMASDMSRHESEMSRLKTEEASRMTRLRTLSKNRTTDQPETLETRKLTSESEQRLVTETQFHSDAMPDPSITEKNIPDPDDPLSAQKS